MVILIDTGILKKAFIAGAGADDTLTILTIFIVLTLCITFAAVQWVTLKLVLRQTQRFCVGTAICHVIFACVCTLSLIAACGFGGFLVGADGSAIAAVTGIIAMNVDANVLLIACTKGFLFVLAR